ncbi:MAG TPA: hypothetical protein VFQ34_10820 [Nitrospiraceae bacterium]|jgi:hypothetical protein|nr:hypothetical protein [Nitrospiraceae bacterium]
MTADSLTEAELRITARYAEVHPWVVQAVTGFLSAYFMEHPGFRVRRHFDEPQSGMHVWLCEVPSTLRMPRLLKRLQADIPPCRILNPEEGSNSLPSYVIDQPDPLPC